MVKTELNMTFIYISLLVILILLIIMFIFCYKGIKETFQNSINYNIPGYQYSNGILTNPTGQMIYNDNLAQYNYQIAQEQARASASWQQQQERINIANASAIWRERLKAPNGPIGPPVKWPYPDLSAIGSSAITVCPFAGCVGVGYGNIFNNPGYGNVVVTGADYYDPDNPLNPPCLNIDPTKQPIPSGYIEPGTPCI